MDFWKGCVPAALAGGRAESPGAWLLHSLAGLRQESTPSTYALVHSRGCWVRAILKHFLTGMSPETCCQQWTSLNTGTELVPEWVRGADKKSHEGVMWYGSVECGEILRQSAPRCDSSSHRVLLFRATAAAQSSCSGVLKIHLPSFFSDIKVYSLHQVKSHL